MNQVDVYKRLHTGSQMAQKTALLQQHLVSPNKIHTVHLSCYFDKRHSPIKFIIVLPSRIR